MGGAVAKYVTGPILTKMLKSDILSLENQFSKVNPARRFGMDIPIELEEHHQRLTALYDSQKNWRNMSELELWEELCLCILSSNVLFETAVSAFLQLAEKGMLNL